MNRKTGYYCLLGKVPLLRSREKEQKRRSNHYLEERNRKDGRPHITSSCSTALSAGEGNCAEDQVGHSHSLPPSQRRVEPLPAGTTPSLSSAASGCALDCSCPGPFFPPGSCHSSSRLLPVACHSVISPPRPPFPLRMGGTWVGRGRLSCFPCLAAAAAAAAVQWLPLLS